MSQRNDNGNGNDDSPLVSPDTLAPRNSDDADRSAAQEDREAILSRRKFLIETALVNAGIAVAVTGCPQDKPQVCLKVAAPDDAKSPPPTKAGTGDVKANAGDGKAPPPEPPVVPDKPAPEACLKVLPPDDTPPVPVKPEACLKVMPPDDTPPPKPEPKPQVCLKVMHPDDRPKPKPEACLKVMPDPPNEDPKPDPSDKPRPRVCLKVRPPDKKK